ncbi:spore germination protein [Paenibacillus sp. GD4]|uniref:spore germination protein n=1 Tax=Paenibacillus sp. GD4 TaxID=3068890 RepID=UPI002796BDB9|nr:spore germination protein [Paenibacillus sp. GD4]MDQ1914059.1 spore germination protein [Paenibacillus sp. GD4]
MEVCKKITDNLHMFENIFENCSDIVFREITIHGKTRILLIYVDGMINTEMITNNVLKPLLYNGLPQGLGTIDSIAQMCEQELVSVLQNKKLSNSDEIAENILKGSVALFAEEERLALLLNCPKFETRGIEESTNEATLRGTRESFTEHLRTNTSMLRRILTTPKLKMESLQIGKLTNTDVIIAYIDGIVSTSVLTQVRERIHKIQLDGILESGYIEESIEDTHLSPFPQMLGSERPDVVSAALLEGKVAVLTSGTPNVLIIPMTFWDGLQAPDDYYERAMYISMNRWIRYIFAAFSVLFPSLYVALTNFHPEMVPPKLMLSIAGLREKSPFPTVIEVLMMEVMFEGLREAGIRLPKQIGPLVSIVGAVVIGEAAVRAGIISSPIVIVVSAAGISSFVIPRYRFSIPMRMLRFPVLILSGLFGLYGIAMGIIAILIHLIHLNPFGKPYLAPAAPRMTRRIRNVFFRWPRKLAVHNELEGE